MRLFASVFPVVRSQSNATFMQKKMYVYSSILSPHNSILVVKACLLKVRVSVFVCVT